MARKIRMEYAGAAYHVMACGNQEPAGEKGAGLVAAPADDGGAAMDEPAIVDRGTGVTRAVR